MAGMDRHTGQRLDGEAHIRQSVGDILSTAIGSHVGLRDYGSTLPDCTDQPFAAASVLQLYAATALALSQWEKRIRLRHIRLQRGDAPSSAILMLEAERVDLPRRDPNFRLRLPIPLSAQGSFPHGL